MSDFLADVQITARRVLSRELYKIWHEVHFENYADGADGVPEPIQIVIQKFCVAAGKKAGLLPFAKYWSVPFTKDKLGIAVNLLGAIQKEQSKETRLAAVKERRKVLRKARRKTECRGKHATLAVAA